MNMMNAFADSPFDEPTSGPAPKMATVLLLGSIFFGFHRDGFALGQAPYVENVRSPGCFAIADDNATATIHVDSTDHAGVIRAANDLRADVARVTGKRPALIQGEGEPGPNAILVGTLGRSGLIDRMVQEGKIDVAAIREKWESFLIQVVPNPMPGVASGLVIAGSDKRGTIFGIYDLSEQMGVSPWYWWGDVPAEQKAALFVKAGAVAQGPPSVKYRGIFLNDEYPDLTRWVEEKYGTVVVPGGGRTANYGRAFYTNVFELILRLKGNYLWPAMWNNRFNEDDPENPRLADEYGIVMGTSHHEPMLRAQKEWDWGSNYGGIYHNWNYGDAKQQPVLQQFWREGVRRNRDFESIVTVGLRAENDSAVPVGKDLTAEIVKVQRQILAEEINPDVTKVPQLWCLYKEVQNYYDAGMRVPDDITLLWSDDNWGDLRRLPTAEERQRAGGAGVYYHFDYHGGPRSYQWINTSPIAKIWDQLSLAKEYGADRIWIVNVGHFKGYEFPLDYFMNLAWETGRWTNNNLNEFTRLWAEREFGPANAGEIAEVIARSTQYNGRRKPELLSPGTYSLDHYQEAERVEKEFQDVSSQADAIENRLPQAKRDAFYELVYLPIKAAAQLNELYLAAARNAAYARQGRASANDMAAQTRELFQAQTNLMNYFNKTFAGGKWDHFMDQPFLGYTNWRDPAENSLRAIQLTEISVPEAPAMGMALDGSDEVWPGAKEEAALPQFDNFTRRRHYIDLFNKGKTPFQFTASASDPWIVLSETEGTVAKDKRLWVNVDWRYAPRQKASGTVLVAGANTSFVVRVDVFNPTEVTRDTVRGFVESEGVVSIEPEHFTRASGFWPGRWIKIEDYGRTLSGMRAEGPAAGSSAAPGPDSPCLEYQMYLFDTGRAEVTAVTGPTLNFVPGRGLRFALSFDDGPPEVITLAPEGYQAQNGNPDWEKSVEDNARFGQARFLLDKPGYHVLKAWMMDAGVVLQKLVVDLGGLKPSYLGPPESYYNRSTSTLEDWQRMMDLLHIPAPGPFPAPADDPKRPAHTHPAGANSPNWSDDVPGHTIVRSGWGHWSNYDEDKADCGPLPDPLVLKNGRPVTDAETWWKVRRPEILNDFLTEIYGKIPSNTPPVTWEVTATETNAVNGTAKMKSIVGHIDNSQYRGVTPSIKITLYTPANASGPVPTIISIPGPFGPFRRSPTGREAGPMREVLALGWGYATINTGTIQADNGAGLASGIIGLVNKGQPRKPDDWGVLEAWSWGLSRAIDYFETDRDIDAKRLGMEGHSRWGKAALLAAALDPRWAIVYSSCSGECGAKLHRHDIGESVDNVAGPGEYHWMAGNFLKYAGHWNDLPIDQHELIALVAPRPAFITGGTQDLWSDPSGEFKACVAAGPVYRLLGKKDLGVTRMPAPDEGLMAGDLAFRMHAGGHTDALDWPVFLDFAKRYFNAPAK
jgi:hypothetical protein